MIKRYFDESNSFKPGVLSDNLRNAIGISKKKLPIWIYKMRVLGYPPGWLKKADMTNTTIKLFDGFENNQHDDKVKYNTDSFFEYPGFNTPPPKNVKDDCERLGMPPMMPFQQLNYAKKTISTLKPVPYKRLKLSNELGKEKIENSTNNENNGKESKNFSNEKKNNEEKKNASVNYIVISDDSINQETNTDLKDNLDSNKEFNENNLSLVNKNSEISKEHEINIDFKDNLFTNKDNEKLDVIIIDDNEEENNLNIEKEKSNADERLEINSVFELSMSNKVSLDLMNDSKESGEKSQNQDEDKFNIENSDYIETQSTSSKITLISMGAPVPASLNGEKPPLENFAVGMGELIYFENLPTSTGVFDKMRKVIKKIRKKLS